MKYTLMETGKTYNVPDEYINKMRRKYSISVKEAIFMYLSDEGILVDPAVQELIDKAKVNGVGAGAGRKTGKRTVTRKPDETKRALMKCIEAAINEYADAANVEITNVERVLSFSIGDDKYELTLSKKRKPKA